MFGLFGKRHIDDAQRTMPVEAWPGLKGDALQAAGLSPDDPGNLLNGSHPIDVRVAKAKWTHQQHLAVANEALAAQHPGCTLATQFIFGEATWNGPHSALLLGTLQLTPYDRWNVRLLPADDWSAAALGEPRVYLGDLPPAMVANVDRLIGEIATRSGLTRGPGARYSSAQITAMSRQIAGLMNYIYVEHMLPMLRS